MENIKSKIEILPLEEFEKLGLYKDGDLKIKPQDVESLLSGRRTDIISLKGLQVEGIEIEKLDAKLSLYRDTQENITLQIHPIYNKPQKHPLLTTDETDALISQQVNVISKMHKTKNDQIISINIEYDKETKDFVSYDPSRLPQIISVNGISLSEIQQDDFKKGKLIELHDGTKLQHSATDSQGILSDRKRLILSVLIDGGLSYLIFRELKNLWDNKNHQTEGLTKSYNETLAKIIYENKENLDKQYTVEDFQNLMDLSQKNNNQRYPSR
ncbi:DUF4099 domain-containing protein [Sphingobacterium bovistauri]|uniref:DUF4099 domain-containing protein n=1 Tax=Sphingobacterium bovistauri TaxID=2781959 RepID=A0ABS7Z388_9SPHI|nr:DUF4099 domain-containing protein [Sphingobacterium bovistauri]MCA5004032.1 DUF4099 domain-containing protein [Sphingobacterium bovistauri]